jgi:hypothetical protein
VYVQIPLKTMDWCGELRGGDIVCFSYARPSPQVKGAMKNVGAKSTDRIWTRATVTLLVMGGDPAKY